VCTHTNLKLEERLELYEIDMLPWDKNYTNNTQDMHTCPIPNGLWRNTNVVEVTYFDDQTKVIM
jgi:hypothetical protein